ncbi:MAG: hypothetical protein H6510_14685 [Acidobacteria bacterium]|nr:hypothetical protein [Acidobacteriota bacterium]
MSRVPKFVRLLTDAGKAFWTAATRRRFQSPETMVGRNPALMVALRFVLGHCLFRQSLSI